MNILRALLGDANSSILKTFQKKVSAINALEEDLFRLSDEALRERAETLKEILGNGRSPGDILPEAFALVREAARRTLSQRHFDVQLLGGMALHEGNVAEMKTGEGKTLVATLPAFLNALEGKGVHIVTVNDYLAKRDAVWMGQIYHALGLSVGCIMHDASYLYDPAHTSQDETRDAKGGFLVVREYLRPVSRREAYLADITYGTNNEFGFDYLRDNMARDLSRMVQRGHRYAIVDEVDSILIDEARTPLIISAPDQESSHRYQEFARLIPRLVKGKDYEIDEKMRAVTLTEEGINAVERMLGVRDIYQEKGTHYLHHLEQSLKAEVLFFKDKDYVVRNGEIIIIDEFTGRLLPGRRYSGGLHQAIEAKERVSVQAESITLASITFQNYFRLYDKLSGMTGTAVTSGEEFHSVYGLDVISIPTHKPMARKDLPDRVYKTEEAKFRAVAREIKERHQTGQPVLVGTVSIAKNELLGSILSLEGVQHEMLNAKNHEREGAIIAQAGRRGSVTVATNMAGRGVDIVLGGNPVESEDAEAVKNAGGLHVIGTERHEARRIDNQLRGRSGRQGDPGSSQFFVSLDDDVIRVFGGERIKGLMETLNFPEDEPIESSLVSRAIEAAQGKIEGFHFDSRKHVLDYDNVLNKHREVVYKKRRDVLERSTRGGLREIVLEMIERAGVPLAEYEAKERELGAETMERAAKEIILQTMDALWVEHLENMEELRDSVRLRAYGQQDPLVEYKNEGHRMFKELLLNTERLALEAIMHIQNVSFAPVPSVAPQDAAPSQFSKTGRNDPCPCGAVNSDTGRPYKYKHCGLISAPHHTQ